MKNPQTNHDPNDPLAMYLDEVSGVKPLSRDEETQQFRQLGAQRDWDDTSESIARKLIEDRLGLVVSIAQRRSESGVPMRDLIEAGNLGLIHGVKSFAENPLGDFTVYASARIDDAIAKVLPPMSQ